jgi:hypothetical protein
MYVLTRTPSGGSHFSLPPCSCCARSCRPPLRHVRGAGSLIDGRAWPRSGAAGGCGCGLSWSVRTVRLCVAYARLCHGPSDLGILKEKRYPPSPGEIVLPSFSDSPSQAKCHTFPIIVLSLVAAFLIIRSCSPAPRVCDSVVALQYHLSRLASSLARAHQEARLIRVHKHNTHT